jgi:2-oxoglutarate dehydrogenase E2 component (dihydrolipoamide succinyltransferase)
MKIDIKIPAMGESISEAILSEWVKADGDYVKRNENILVLESDKANFDIQAEKAGQLSISVEADETVAVGAVVGTIDTSVEAPASAEATAGEPVAKSDTVTEKIPAASKDIHPDLKKGLSPATQRVVSEKGLDPAGIKGTGRDGRLTKGDVMSANIPGPEVKKGDLSFLERGGEQIQRREKMSSLRRRIAERLVNAQQTAAILTTFNEVDMSALVNLKKQYNDTYKEKYGTSLGFMGFFSKACAAAVRHVPEVNAFIDGEEIVYNDYVNMGIAVSSPRGLVVPVVKNVDMMSIPEIDMAIRHYALKARDGKLGLDDMQGGTFTISNGGVFGSMMSTPILNAPQSAILGMHAIEDRPVALDGQVVIRPMMYVALSYDHRMIDGKGAVTFLKTVKEFVEYPHLHLLGL